MKFMFLILVLVFTGLVMAEMKPCAAPVPAADSLQQNHPCFGHPDAMMGNKSGFGMQNCPMAEKGREHMGPCRGMENCPAPFMMHHPGHFMFIKLKILAGLLFLCALFMAAINTLLTILVSLDMKKRGAFNGLWIPLLLIAGIPTSVIYALFRIGDNIQKKG
jgi:hypothetical protein